MAENRQTYATHTRWYPLVHFVLTPLFLVNFVASAWTAMKSPSGATLWAAVVALGILLLLFAARLMALTVQDRVIRLEERLRMRELLPADLHGRIGELSREHFVGLRFAGDAELPELTRRVLAGELKTQTEIKKAVAQWRADHLRA